MERMGTKLTVCPGTSRFSSGGGLSSGPPRGSSQLERRLPPMENRVGPFEVSGQQRFWCHGRITIKEGDQVADNAKRFPSPLRPVTGRLHLVAPGIRSF